MLGEAEVGHFDLAGLFDEDVGRFDVAVDDALGVGVGEGVADVGGDGEGVGLRQPALGADELGGVGAVHELHDDVKHAGAGLAEVPDIDDAGVPHSGHGARLVFEAPGELGAGVIAGGKGAGQDLEGHHAVE